MQRMKTQKLIHIVRVKKKPKRAVESDKPVDNGKGVRARKVMAHMKVEHAHKAHAPSTYT